MQCPKCGTASGVRDSRRRGHTIHRKRHCPKCGEQWNTIELVVGALQRRTGAPDKVPVAHPVVRAAFEEKARLGLSYKAWSAMSRVAVSGIKKMRTSGIPRVDTLDAMLRPLGCMLTVRRISPGREEDL